MFVRLNRLSEMPCLGVRLKLCGGPEVYVSGWLSISHGVGVCGRRCQTEITDVP